MSVKIIEGWTYNERAFAGGEIPPDVAHGTMFHTAEEVEDHVRQYAKFDPELFLPPRRVRVTVNVEVLE